jgi:hypothetical protein
MYLARVCVREIETERVRERKREMNKMHLVVYLIYKLENFCVGILSFGR